MWVAQDVAWVICGIYATIPSFWLMVHPFANRWRSARLKLKALAPLWMAMWIVAWAASFAWRHDALYSTPWAWLAVPMFLSASVLMYINGVKSLSIMRVIGRHELEPQLHSHELVTTGVHRYVRHPLYTGHLCSMLAFAIGAGTKACFGLLAFALATFAIMIPLEERELRERFGNSWEEYKQRTPAMLPWKLLR